MSGVLFAFPSGQEVSVAFTLPTDYASMTNVVYNNSYQMPARNYDEIFEDMNSNKGRGRHRYDGGINNYNSTQPT